MISWSDMESRGRVRGHIAVIKIVWRDKGHKRKENGKHKRVKSKWNKYGTFHGIQSCHFQSLVSNYQTTGNELLMVL